jgi:hypothetical protein
MYTPLTKIILSTVAALTIVACGGSGVGIGLAGIGGSGFISSGTISGFGSVFVNGVEFEVDSATFDIDGNPDGVESDLAIGMVVQVNGTINDDGVTGTATSISFDEELQGPVSAVGATDADGIKRSLTILGLTVIIDSSSTTFDIDNDSIPASTVFDFDTIVVNNNVEVSGFFDTNGDLQATRIELKDIDFDSSNVIEVEGIITGLSGTTFSLDNFGSLMINAATASLDDLPNGLEDGQLVEVKGNLDAGATTLTATRVEGEDNSADDTDEFELEGIITDYVNDSNFKIGGITVDAGNPNVTREPLSLILENDAHVEVEGAIVNGILIATEVASEGGDIKVHANVTSIDVLTNTFEVSPISGQAITVTVTTSTQLEDEVNDIELFTLNDLVVTNFVEVRGFDDGNGGINAIEIDVRVQDDVIVQGHATAATGSATAGGTVTVLGIEFNFDSLTDFEDINDVNLTQNQINTLINSISSGTPQLIKIQDNEAGTGGNAVGTADEIDIE